MKITYIAICYSSSESGVGKKIQDQISFWRSRGHQVLLYLLTSQASNNDWVVSKIADRIWIDDKYVTKQKNRRDVFALAKKNEAEIVYFRDAFPFYFKSNKIKKVLEVNSIQKNEVTAQSFMKKTIYSLLARYYYSRWDGFVYVTEEIKSSLEREIPAMAKLPSTVISNGINLGRIPRLPVSQASNLNFVFLGEPGLPWNGISSIVDLASALPGCNFHVIGESNLSKFETTPNMNFYGFMRQADYQNVLKLCQVAIGTMEVERKKMVQGCSLKTREYLAAGLPVVIRYEETDFQEGAQDFILNLPVDGKPMSFYSEQIAEFAEKWRFERVAISEVSTISIELKEAKRIEFLSSLIR